MAIAQRKLIGSHCRMVLKQRVQRILAPIARAVVFGGPRGIMKSQYRGHGDTRSRKIMQLDAKFSTAIASRLCAAYTRHPIPLEGPLARNSSRLCKACLGTFSHTPGGKGCLSFSNGD